MREDKRSFRRPHERERAVQRPPSAATTPENPPRPPPGDPYWSWRKGTYGLWHGHPTEWRVRDNHLSAQERLTTTTAQTGPSLRGNRITGPSHPVATRKTDRQERRACEAESLNVRALAAMPQARVVLPYTPLMTEVRCPACGAGSVVWNDTSETIREGVEGASRLLQGRWADMTCEEVKNLLTILVIMES